MRLEKETVDNLLGAEGKQEKCRLERIRKLGLFKKNFLDFLHWDMASPVKQHLQHLLYFDNIAVQFF